MDPQHDKAKHEKVVGNKMRAYIRCGNFVITGPQMIHVCNLEKQDNNPVYVDNDMVQGERCWIGTVLAPDCSCAPFIVRSIPCKVDVHYMDEEPGQEGQDLVSKKRPVAMLLTLGERIDWSSLARTLAGISGTVGCRWQPEPSTYSCGRVPC